MRYIFTVLLIIFSFNQTIDCREKRLVRIGIVTQHLDDSFLQFAEGVVKSEMQKTLGSSYHLKLDREDMLLTDNPEAAVQNYKLLAGRCDAIFIYGPVVVKNLLTSFKGFSKPTFGIGVFDTELQEIPYTSKGTSGLKNFSYVLTKNSMDVDLEKFKEMVDFKKLTVIYEKNLESVISEKKGLERFARLEKKYEASFNYAPMDGDYKGLKKRIVENGADSVYFVVPLLNKDKEVRKVVNIINQLKLPSFAFNNDAVVSGILGSYGSQQDYKISVIRKLAIMVDEALNGVDPAVMQVSLHDQEGLFINMDTAQKIDYSPPFNILFSAEIVGEDSRKKKKYSIEEIMASALEKNLSIKISKKDLELADSDLKDAVSNYLPEITSSLSASFLDKDATNAAAGRSERSLAGSVGLNQLIYSDKVVAGIKIQKYLKLGQKFSYHEEVNSVILSSLQLYLGVLKAKTAVIIQEENYRSSKKNLDFAELRVRLGASDKSEVFRWRSEVATARQQVIEAHINEETAMVQLNTLLDNSLEEEFDIDDVSLHGDFFKRSSGILGLDSINNPKDLRFLTDFLIQKSENINPGELSLNAKKKAVEKQIGMNRRAFWLPSISLGGKLDNTFSRGGAGSQIPEGMNLPDTTWSASLNLAYPIFEGNRRKIELSRNILKKKQLDFQEKALKNSIALNIKTGVIELAGASTNIIFSEISSKNAEKNYKLVQDNYKQGTVSIVQLIDAQKASLNAKQAYAVSVYNFLDKLFQLEHDVGYFYFYSGKDGKNEFETEFGKFKDSVRRR